MKSYLNNCCPKETYVYYAMMQSLKSNDKDLQILMSVMHLVEDIPNSDIYYYMAYNLLLEINKPISNNSNVICTLNKGHSINVDADIVYSYTDRGRTNVQSNRAKPTIYYATPTNAAC